MNYGKQTVHTAWLHMFQSMPFDVVRLWYVVIKEGYVHCHNYIMHMYSTSRSCIQVSSLNGFYANCVAKRQR